MSAGRAPAPGGFSRRAALKLGAAGACLPFLSRIGVAQEAGHHSLSVFGDFKYPPDFKHFDYVRPDAPKGGTLSTVVSQWAYNQSPVTFNSLNSFILKGDAAAWIENIFDTLMIRAADEPDTLYGLVAHSFTVSDDCNQYRFLLRDDARFHDGSALTAEDAAFSLNLLKEKGHPLIAQAIREMVAAQAVNAHELHVSFSGKQARDLPLTIAGLPIFSKTYYGAHAFEETTLDVPLGSGPYRVGQFEQGRFIDYERVGDYWAKDLPVNVGRWNFDKIRIEFYRDRDVSFEAFKGGAYRIREEFTSRSWAKNYEFPAVQDGRVIRLVLPDDSPSGAQGWFINIRREKFTDPRVREALIQAFDFEWVNANLMFNSYTRTHSFFENSDMKAEGPPSAEELALLEPFRDRLPAEVFGDPFSPPVSDGSGRDRKLLRRAGELLSAAGWTIQNGKRINAAGEQFSLEILDRESGFEPHASAFIANLTRLGIAANFRVVDPAQFEDRLKNFDFDLTPSRFSLSVTPGDETRLYWGSESAKTPGSRNLSGIADPVIDALIEIIVKAESREALTTACKAVDRVLRAGRYWVPHWYKGSHWIAMWNEFDRPKIKPRYDRGIMDTWWHAPNGMSDKG